MTCVGLVWRPWVGGSELVPARREPVSASGFARASSSRQCHVGARQRHLHGKKSRIHMSVQKSHVFYILGSEAGDHQGQEFQGLDLV